MIAAGAAPLLIARNIRKQFGSFRALDAVSLELAPGEVHGLLGANGAGKSTFIGVLSGAVHPEEGSLEIAGRRVRLGSLRDARAAGLSVVHQELMLFPDLSVEDNIFASVLSDSLPGFIDRKERRRRAEVALDKMGATLDLRRRAGDLPLSHRQLVEIARAICSGGRVIVLDEPTSALSQPEAQGLFAAIRSIVADNAAVVFVSHRLDEVFAITDRITVLRDGRVEGRWRTADVDVSSVMRTMVGDLAGKPRRRPVASATSITPALAIEGSSFDLPRIQFAIAPGEVVGFAGLEGSGVAAALAMMGGLVPIVGKLEVSGRKLTFSSPADALRSGVVFMPPDRKKGGLWLERASTFNIGAASLFGLGPFAWLRSQEMNKVAAARLSDVGVRSNALHETVGRLSGGNQQRLLLGRSLEFRPKVLLLNDFTRGVDVSAKAAIHALVRRLAEDGVAICVTSSDLEELLDVADRILCMRNGKVVADRPSSGFDKLSLLGLASTPSEVSGSVGAHAAS